VSFSCVGFFRKKFRARIAWQRRSPSRSTHSIPAFVAAVSSASSHRQQFRSGNPLVNPDFAGKSRWFGSASYEALRVTVVSNIEYILALPQCVFHLAIVNRRWRQQAYAGVTVLVVVPRKKSLTDLTPLYEWSFFWKYCLTLTLKEFYFFFMYPCNRICNLQTEVCVYIGVHVHRPGPQPQLSPRYPAARVLSRRLQS
jgi:hypothetical protein